MVRWQSRWQTKPAGANPRALTSHRPDDAKPLREGLSRLLEARRSDGGWRGSARTLALTGHFIGTDRGSKGLVVLGVHTRSAKTRRALLGGVRHGYHHASHHRTCRSAAWWRRLVRPGPLVLSNETHFLESKTEFNGIGGLRTYLSNVPVSLGRHFSKAVTGGPSVP